jgi:hypothetical protein
MGSFLVNVAVAAVVVVVVVVVVAAAFVDGQVHWSGLTAALVVGFLSWHTSIVMISLATGEEEEVNDLGEQEELLR